MDKTANRRARLQELIARYENQAEFVRVSGENQSEVSGLLKAKSFGEKKARKIEAAVGLPSGWLDQAAGSAEPTGQVQTLAPAGALRMIPVISWVQAGAWNKVGDVKQISDVDEWVPAPVAGGPRCFSLRVVGDSMFNPDGEPSFSENDRIIVDPDRDPQHRSLVIVQLTEEVKATFKQLIIENDRKYLKAINPSWPNRIFEVNGNATCCGVVIGKHVSYV